MALAARNISCSVPSCIPRGSREIAFDRAATPRENRELAVLNGATRQKRVRPIKNPWARCADFMLQTFSQQLLGGCMHSRCAVSVSWA